MKRALVIGSGAGGATAAKELQGAFEVTVLEAGDEFQPLTLSLRTLERLKSTHLLFDERLIHFPFPAMQIRKTPDMVLVNGVGTGGSTAVCAGNAVRMDQDLRAIGIDLDEEFEEIFQEIPDLHGAPEALAQAHEAALQDLPGDGAAARAHAEDGRVRALQELRPVHSGLPGGSEMGQPPVP